MRSSMGRTRLAKRLPAAPDASPCGDPPGCSVLIHWFAAQGVTTKAITSERNMPMLALIGMGLM